MAAVVSLLHLAAAKWPEDRVLLQPGLQVDGLDPEHVTKWLMMEAESTMDPGLSARSRWHALKLLMAYTGQTTRESIRAVFAWTEADGKDHVHIKYKDVQHFVSLLPDIRSSSQR